MIDFNITSLIMATNYLSKIRFVFTNHEHSPTLLPLEGERRIRSRRNLIHGTNFALSEAEQDLSHIHDLG